MISQDQQAFFAENGYLIIEAFESPERCDRMLEELSNAIEDEHCKYPDVFDAGMVHNCFLHGRTMREHLSRKNLREATDTFLCKNAIIYAYQASSLRPGHGNYGSRIHVDCPRFIPGYRTNLGYILALQEFTKRNGGTWILPGSHLSEAMPSVNEFQRGAIQLTCDVGSAIFFDARLVHKAGENHTEQWRHAISINFCRPFMRSRFDFPKLIGEAPWINELDGSARKFLGFDVRMPASLEEFYLPARERLYLPDQE